jgi:transposase InsO family protein
VGYCLYKTLETDGPLIALNIAINGLKGKSKKIIHHSDRGIQYCCDEYIKSLQDVHFEISMAEKGNPYENAIAERMNGILKENYNLKKVFNSWEEANQKVDAAIYSYNCRRPHGSIEGLRPFEAHQKEGKLKKKWKEKKGFLRHGQNLQE